MKWYCIRTPLRHFVGNYRWIDAAAVVLVVGFLLAIAIGIDVPADVSDINPLAPAQTERYRRLVGQQQEVISECLRLHEAHDEAFKCVNDILRTLARTYGARFALDVVQPLSQQEAFFLRRSHDLAHTIGDFAMLYPYEAPRGSNVDVDGFSAFDLSLINTMGRVLVECDGWGAFGCYHGVIEVGLSRLAPNERTRVVRQACMDNPLIQSRRFYTNQCLHWFGHGMAVFTNQSLDETLAVCERLDPEFNNDNVQLCLSGVFHAGGVPGEVDIDFLENTRRVYNPEDPYFPCQEIPERFHGQCYSQVPGRSGTSNTAVVFANCDAIPEPDPTKRLDYIHRCYDSGANLLLVNADFNTDKVMHQCRADAHPAYLKYCYAGAVRYWILRDPLLNNTGPIAICSMAELETKLTCYRALGAANNENYFDREILETYCSKIKDPEYYEECLKLEIPD